MFQLRPLHEQDVVGIAAVHRRACLIAYAFMGWSYSEQDVRDWYGTKFREWTWGLVAEVEDAIVGFVACGNAHLDQLFVDPGHQRRGLGARMLAAAMERTPPVETLNVYQQNRAARRFYERHGFGPLASFWNDEAGAVELLYGRVQRLIEPL